MTDQPADPSDAVAQPPAPVPDQTWAAPQFPAAPQCPPPPKCPPPPP